MVGDCWGGSLRQQPVTRTARSLALPLDAT